MAGRSRDFFFSMTDVVARRLRVTGRVQGVFYRATTQEKARELGLVGWVCNTEDGAVEVHAEGRESAIETLIEWCKNGPPGARVDGVDVAGAVPEGFVSFDIRHD